MAQFHISKTSSTTPDLGWQLVCTDRAADSNSTLGARESLRAQLRHLLSCDHLMVLAGLGTSLTIPSRSATTGRDTLFPLMSDLWKAVEATTSADFEWAIGVTKYPDDGKQDIELLLSRCQMIQQLGVEEHRMSQFINDAEQVIASECRQGPTADELQHHIHLLRRLVRRPDRAERVELFTTNYDECFERAAAAVAFPLIDGFTIGHPQRFELGMFDLDLVVRSKHSDHPTFMPSVIRLFKVHGSVDWERTPDARVVKRPDTKSPLLIYPASSKFQTSYQQPFLELMARFQNGLRRRNVGLLVLCSGFNDQHLAGPIMAAVEANPTLRTVVVAPDLSPQGARELYKNDTAKGTSETNVHLRKLSSLAASEDEHVMLVNANLASLIDVLPSQPMTDQERREVAEQVAAAGGSSAGGANA